VVFNNLEPGSEEVRFSTRSGDLLVKHDGEKLVMDFPAMENQPVAIPAGLEAAIGATIEQAFTSLQDLMVVVGDAETVRNLEPDFDFIATGIKERGLIVTAFADDCDFVSRFFALREDIKEDPVTGSAHCQMVPYWSK